MVTIRVWWWVSGKTSIPPLLPKPPSPTIRSSGIRLYHATANWWSWQYREIMVQPNKHELAFSPIEFIFMTLSKQSFLFELWTETPDDSNVYYYVTTASSLSFNEGAKRPGSITITCIPFLSVWFIILYDFLLTKYIQIIIWTTGKYHINRTEIIPVLVQAIHWILSWMLFCVRLQLNTQRNRRLNQYWKTKTTFYLLIPLHMLGKQCQYDNNLSVWWGDLKLFVRDKRLLTSQNKHATAYL